MPNEQTPISAISGVLPIDKAAGMTSHDVVARVRRVLRPVAGKAKVGHAGTLDPDATGLLLVCVGAATRLADLLAEQGKRYEARFTLGVTTTTEDASGETLAERNASHVTRAEVERALQSLTGEIQQAPPMVSAVHHEGRRLYELARQGIVVERAARTITVERIELLSFDAGAARPQGEMIVDCGKGTYIRTLCADLGERLGVGGHMAALRRTRIGAFEAEDAIPFEALDAEMIQRRIVTPADAIGHFLPLRRISAAERADILHGRAITLGTVNGDINEDGWLGVVDEAGELVALGVVDSATGLLLPKKVLAG